MDSKHASEVLQSLGFDGLKFISHEGMTFTFKYTSDDPKRLRGLGKPTVAASGKVAVYVVPEIGRLGVSPSNSVLRLIADKVSEKPVTNDDHVNPLPIPPEYSKAFEQAKVTPTKQVPYLKKLWQFFNREKFGHKMVEPAILCSKIPPFPRMKSTTSGAYSQGYGARSASVIWINQRIFNAREHIFLETLVHEMCHQAVAEIDRNQLDGDHGPNWKSWMTRCGLKPLKYDLTDQIEYMDSKQAKILEIEKNAKKLGKQHKQEYFDGLKAAPKGYTGPCIMQYKKYYALDGVLEPLHNDRLYKYKFTWKTPNGNSAQVFLTDSDLTVNKVYLK